jgi:hypothetical protein
MSLRIIASFFALISLFAACRPPVNKPADVTAEGPGYFSIAQFITDQWNTHRGQPYGMQKVVYMNGKVDSSLISAYDVDWGPIFKTFIETDISDLKYLDRYTFSEFADDATMTHNFFYEAKEESLFTRKLHIAADDVNHKVRSIYIETSKNGKWSNFSQKLFYMPMKVISIQEFEWAQTGPKKELRVEYRFL